MGNYELVSIMLKGAALLLVALLIKLCLTYPFFLSPLRSLPGLSAGVPLFGQCMKLFTTNNGPNATLLEWSKKWSKEPFVKYLSIENSEVLLINSLQAHQEIKTTKVYSLVKPSFFRIRRCADTYARSMLRPVGPYMRGLTPFTRCE